MFGQKVNTCENSWLSGVLNMMILSAFYYIILCIHSQLLIICTSLCEFLDLHTEPANVVIRRSGRQ